MRKNRIRVVTGVLALVLLGVVGCGRSVPEPTTPAAARHPKKGVDHSGRRRMTYDIIAASTHEIPAAVACEAFGVSRSAYHAYVRSKKADPSQRATESVRLDHAIRTAFDEFRGAYGPGQHLLALSVTISEPVDLRVRPSLGDLDDPVKTQVSERLEALATSKDHQPDAASKHILDVSIAWSEESRTDFAVTIGIGTPGNLRTFRSFICAECSAGELLDQTTEAADEALKALFATEIPSPAAEQAPSPEPASIGEASPSNRLPLGRLGWGGVVSLGVGAAGIATGATVLALGERRVEDDPSNLRDFRPAGYAAVGVGTAALVAGVVLLAVDRKRARQRGVAVIPTPAGLQLSF